MNQILGCTALALCLTYFVVSLRELITAGIAAINHPDNEVGDEA